MKSIALLTAGPSLDDCVAQHPLKCFDLVVTVNTAGWKYHQDWHCSLDDHALGPWLRGERALPRVGFACPYRPWSRLKRLARYRQPLKHWPIPRNWHDQRVVGNTFPQALMLAQTLGRVTVLGIDCSIGPDCCGVEPGHTADRWERELAWVKRIARADTKFVGAAASLLNEN